MSAVRGHNILTYARGSWNFRRDVDRMFCFNTLRTPSCTKRSNFISLFGEAEGRHCSGLLTTGEMYDLDHLKCVQANANLDSTHFLYKSELEVICSSNGDRSLVEWWMVFGRIVSGLRSNGDWSFVEWWVVFGRMVGGLWSNDEWSLVEWLVVFCRMVIGLWSNNEWSLAE